MKRLSSIIEPYALATFCALTIALTFAATLLPLSGELVPIVIVFIPAVMAIVLTALSEGKVGVQSLLGKLTRWRIGVKGMLVAVTLGFVIRLMISLMALGLGLSPAIQLRLLPPVQFVVLALILFIFAIPEELGWRGYALPKLLEQRSPLAAGLMIGVLWGTLHLALHLPRMIYAGLPFPPTLLQLIGLSVLITWLYMKTGGNILLTSLLHAAQSFFVVINEGIPATNLVWLMAAVYMAIAFILVIVAGSSFGRKLVPTVEQVVEITHLR